MYQNEELCTKNEKLCITNEELCIKDEDLCIKNDEFCRPIPIILCEGCLNEIEGPSGFLPNPDSPDSCRSDFAQMMAIGLPAISNILIGNVVEPALFGKRLNLTVPSILVALTF